MIITVNKHRCEIEKSPVNEKEINVTKCEFVFSDEIESDYVKEALFTFKGKTYKEIIANDECSIPYEVLEEKGQVELGVVVYKVENGEYEKLYNPSPVYFSTLDGSLKDKIENSQEITPSELEQYQQALNDGLVEVGNVNIDASKSGSVATITITNRYGEEKEVEISDGQDGADGQPGKDGENGKDGEPGKDGEKGADGVGLNYNWQGTSLGIKREDESDYIYIDLQGPGSNIPTITISLSQIVSQSPLQVQLTAEQVAIIQDKTTPIVLMDGSTINPLLKGYLYLNTDMVWDDRNFTAYSFDYPMFHPINGQMLTYSKGLFVLNVTTNIATVSIDQLAYYSDLDNYLSMNNTNSYTPTNDYNPATKKYVDDMAGGSGVVITKSNYNNSDIINAVNEEYQKYLNGESYSVWYKGTLYNANNESCVQLYFQNISNVRYLTSDLLDTNRVINSGRIFGYMYVGTTVSSNNVTALDNPTFQNMIQLANGNGMVIKTQNTTAYTPSGDYNPATKKYVDDSISSAIGSALGGSY